jgi:hypothetical protein
MELGVMKHAKTASFMMEATALCTTFATTTGL